MLTIMNAGDLSLMTNGVPSRQDSTPTRKAERFLKVVLRVRKLAVERRQVCQNMAIEKHNQRQAGGVPLTRRAFVAGVAGAGLLAARHRPADIILNIERAQIDVAPGH